MTLDVKEFSFRWGIIEPDLIRKKCIIIQQLNKEFFLLLMSAIQYGFQNVFPLANSFSEGKMLGAGRHPTGPEWREYGKL